MAELGVTVSCVYIKSSLSGYGVDEQMDYVTNNFHIDLKVVNSSHWLENESRGQGFFYAGRR